MCHSAMLSFGEATAFMQDVLPICSEVMVFACMDTFPCTRRSVTCRLRRYPRSSGSIRRNVLTQRGYFVMMGPSFPKATNGSRRDDQARAYELHAVA